VVLGAALSGGHFDVRETGDSAGIDALVTLQRVNGSS
jgi:hypothetical protein